MGISKEDARLDAAAAQLRERMRAKPGVASRASASAPAISHPPLSIADAEHVIRARPDTEMARVLRQSVEAAKRAGRAALGMTREALPSSPLTLREYRDQ